MNRFSQRFVSVFAGLALLSSAAVSIGSVHAADMLADPGMEYTPVEFGTGWYLRGDVGATISNVPSTLPEADPDDTFGTASSLGIGGGYMFNNNIRLEGQISHMTGLDFAAADDSQNCLAYDRGDGFGVRADNGYCYYKQRSDVTATSLMANLYIDGPTFFNITPYVGVGGGFTMISWNDYRDYDLCIGVSSAEDCQGLGGGIHILREGEAISETTFAPSWNIMLGAAYNWSKNVKLDVGYRYLSTAETVIAKASNNIFYQSDRTAGGVDVHEVRVGLRYEIW